MDGTENKMVSVIMPLYNSERFVENSILSVIAQTYKDWELFVVDDCSTDSSCAIVEKLAATDNRIILLHTDKPSGSPTLPRNIGIEHANGKYIAFLDSDDMWLSTKLEEQLPFFDIEDTKVIFSYYKKIDAEGTISNNVIKSPANVSYKQLLRGNVIGNLTGIYDTSKAGKHYFENVGHEDYVYWLHILKDGGNAVNTRKVHALYRVRNSSVSSDKLRIFKWDWHIYREVEHLNLPYACFCFICYALKGMKKYLL